MADDMEPLHTRRPSVIGFGCLGKNAAAAVCGCAGPLSRWWWLIAVSYSFLNEMVPAELPAVRSTVMR